VLALGCAVAHAPDADAPLKTADRLMTLPRYSRGSGGPEVGGRMTKDIPRPEGLKLEELFADPTIWLVMKADGVTHT
jgi:hypothetical protein